MTSEDESQSTPRANAGGKLTTKMRKLNFNATLGTVNEQQEFWTCNAICQQSPQQCAPQCVTLDNKLRECVGQMLQRSCAKFASKLDFSLQDFARGVFKFMALEPVLMPYISLHAMFTAHAICVNFMPFAHAMCRSFYAILCGPKTPVFVVSWIKFKFIS